MKHHESVQKDWDNCPIPGTCTVAASAIISGKPFNTCLKASRKLSDVSGKPNRKRVYNTVYGRWMYYMGLACGYKAKSIRFSASCKPWHRPDYTYNAGKPKLLGEIAPCTISTVSRHLREGRLYMIGTSGHIIAAEGRQIRDWTEGRKHRVLFIVEMERVS